MRFKCRTSFIRVGFASCALINCIILTLAVILLLPTLTEGPDNIHYLHRSKCKVNYVEFLPNYLPRDNADDVFAVIYQPALEEGVIARLNITAPDHNISCSYFWPEGYGDNKEAFIEVSKKFVNGTEYDCVVDTINKICYPDQNERETFALWVSIFGGFFAFFLLLYCCSEFDRKKEIAQIADKIKKKKKDKNVEKDKDVEKGEK